MAQLTPQQQANLNNLDTGSNSFNINQPQASVISSANNNIINADALDNPTPDLNLPTGQFDFSNFQAFLQPTQLDTQLRQTQQQQSAQTQDIFSGLLGAMGTTSTQGARTAQAEEAAGIPQLQTDLTDIENQIRQTDLEFRRERERLDVEPGMTMGQRNARLNQLKKSQYSQLADLEVIRQARSNTLTNVESIVQRKLELQFADEKARVNNLKFVYEQLKDDLTKTEDRQFDRVLSREENKLKIAMSQYETLQTEKLNLVRNAQANGAGNQTMSAILQANTLEDAYKAAGSYGMSIDDKIKNANYRKLIEETEESGVDVGEMEKDKDFAKVKGLSELKFTIQEYQKLVDEVGVKRKGTVGGAKLDAKYQEVLQAYRAAKDLGALQGADLSLVDDAIKRATFERSAVGNVLGLGIPAVAKKFKTKRVATSSIDTVFDIIDSTQARLDDIISAKRPTWVSSPYYQSLVGNSNQYEITIDENGNIVIPGDLSNEEFFNQ